MLNLFECKHDAMFVDVLDIATTIHASMGQHFIDPEPGIYIPSLHAPILKFGRMYQRLDTGEIFKLTSLEDLTNNPDSIIDPETGRLLMDKFYIVNNLVNTTPATPTIVLELIRSYLYSYAYTLNDYRRLLPYYITNNIYYASYIRDESAILFNDGKIDPIGLMLPHLDKAMTYIASKPEYIYIIDISVGELQIYRTIDVRAYAWMMEHEGYDS